MRSLGALLLIAAALGGPAAALADECGRPGALGTSRILAVSPREHARLGTMQYPETLPLADKEVVLTFDDGPLPPYTDRILETLAAECVKATFFMVGRQARAYPAMVRRVYNEGHTVASHSQNHPLIFTRLTMGNAQQEIEQGIRSIDAALGDSKALAPFFRFPGLGRSRAVEAYLAGRGIMTFSADFLADDWTHITAQQVLHRALERLEHSRKGSLLLHDIQPATALMLPKLLRELKARGYHVVQVVPAGIDRPESVTEPESWVMHKPKPTWPAVLPVASAKPVPSAQSFGWPNPFRSTIVASMPIPHEMLRFVAVQSPTRLAAAGDPALPMHAQPWMEPAPAIPPFALPSGLGDLTLGPSEEDLGDTLVVPEDTLLSMIVGAPRPAHHKPRPVAGKTRPTPPAAVRATNPPLPRPKVVAHTPSPAGPGTSNQ